MGGKHTWVGGTWYSYDPEINALAQECGNSIANTGHYSLAKSHRYHMMVLGSV